MVRKTHPTFDPLWKAKIGRPVAAEIGVHGTPYN
jgi:hypothetical protein